MDFLLEEGEVDRPGRRPGRAGFDGLAPGFGIAVGGKHYHPGTSGRIAFNLGNISRPVTPGMHIPKDQEQRLSLHTTDVRDATAADMANSFLREADVQDCSSLASADG